jgi:hypothetical protein
MNMLPIILVRGSDGSGCDMATAIKFLGIMCLSAHLSSSDADIANRDQKWRTRKFRGSLLRKTVSLWGAFRGC